jgi:ribosomal protein L29
MSETKVQTKEDLKKMSTEDRNKMIKASHAQLAHTRLRVRSGEDKQNHKVKALKKQIKILETRNRQEQLNAQKNAK